MKRMVARIGPVVPAFATVAASVCASSLLFATGPRALEPPPVVPPLTREVGRVVASLSPPSQTFSRGAPGQTTQCLRAASQASDGDANSAPLLAAGQPGWSFGGSAAIAPDPAAFAPEPAPCAGGCSRACARYGRPGHDGQRQASEGREQARLGKRRSQPRSHRATG